MTSYPTSNTGSVDDHDSHCWSDKDDCCSPSSSISGSFPTRDCITPASEAEPSTAVYSGFWAPSLQEQEAGGELAEIDKDCTKSNHSTLLDASELMPEGPIHLKLRNRSRSVPDNHFYCSPSDAVTMTEEVSSLKSFRNFWQIAQTTSETSLELTAKTDRGGAKSSSVDTGFDFPFIHLDSSDFDFHEYHFPFSRIDSSVFDSPCVRQRTAFPFSHWAQSLFGPESKTEKKPATGEKSEPKKSRPEKKSRTEKKPDSPLSRLMQMVGLDDVKREFLSARDRIKAAQARDEEISVRSLKLDLIITGNHGTGRTTLARLYEEHLESLGVGGYDIAVLDDYDDERSFYAHKGVYIVTSLRENVKDIFGDSDACGRFSRRIDIKDYSEDELLAVLIKMLKEESFKVEGGFKAPFLRSFVRQVARRRSQKDFANIDTLIAEIKKVLHRRVERLEKLTKKKDTVIVNFPHLPYILTESDFCGLNPTNFYEESETWKKLEKMAGMEKVKEAVKELVSRRNSNYARERKGTKALEASLNYVFLGPPGRGKTTVAALFGQIIAELGYIESSEVVIKKPTDFLGSYVGHSEKQTKKILEETEGKILIIDEVHMFYHSSDHGTDDSDIYRKGIVDTIVAHVDNEPGNGRCIILMGYPERMKELYRNTNPGFQRRFPLEDAFVFENYDDEALGQILDIMLTSDGIAATENAKAVAMDVLRRERDRPNFGNGGAVRTLLSRATNTYSRRMETLAKGSQDSGNDATPPGKEEEEPQILLEPQDFDPEYDRGLRVDKDYTSLFQNLVGFQDIITTFKGYQTMAANMRKRDLDPRDQIPFTFVFKGAPGTGKTTTARALGQIYYTMGFLSTTEVMDCSVTDLIGEAQGLTGPKVQNLLERALGKVLFIDEAYRLGQKDLAGVFISRFAQEAVGELVDCMTKERFAHKLVIVLAGYERDMNQLMSTNEGLRGRFSELQFPNMRPRDCLRLLQRKLDEKKVKILDPSKKSRKMALDKVINLFKKLSKTEAWANARDVETLSKRIIRQVFLREDLPVDGKPLTVTLEEIAANLKQLLRERKSKGDRTGNGQKDADPSDSE